MQKTTIFGLPLNPMPKLEALRGASFCVSYGTRDKLGRQLDQAIELVGQDGILLVDNGAFSAWQAGINTMTDVSYIHGFADWANDILARSPQAIAVLPDVIDGSWQDNAQLVSDTLCFFPLDRTMPIWHPHEPIEYLTWLVEEGFGYIGLGSSGEFGKVGTKAWHARIQEALAAIEDTCADGTYVRPRIHMMRAQSQAHNYAFDSSDSTNVAVNHSRQLRVSGEDVAAFAARVDAKIQASAGEEADYQAKRPLLGHVGHAAWEREFYFNLHLEAALAAPIALEGPQDDEPSPPAAPLVVAYGMGVDSTAMLVGLQARGERPDLILFADTGSERPETYAYLETINAWLDRVGFPQVTIVKNASPKAGYTSLEDQITKLRVLPALAYGQHQCSLVWKRDPQQKYVKTWQPAIDAWAAGLTVTQCIGYDAGPRDGARAYKAEGKASEGYTNRFPLIEWGWDRTRCVEEIKAAGLPVPVKSCCWFCPAHKKVEIDQLVVRHPDLVDRALRIERLAQERGLNKIKGLGRNFAWADYLAS